MKSEHLIIFAAVTVSVLGIAYSLALYQGGMKALVICAVVYFIFWFGAVWNAVRIR